jgi:transcriptional regulator with XRE-family HTH domain
MSSFGHVLSTLMKKYGLSGQELERLAGVSSSNIYRVLKNGGNPTIDVLKKLASFFQITVSQLIGEEPLGSKQIPLIPPTEVRKYLHLKKEDKGNYPTIKVDFDLNPKCFATYSEDNMMEPFILINSIIIIDPDRELSNNDFVFIINKNEKERPKIREIIRDGSDFYFKVLNPNYQLPLTNMSQDKYEFVGVIIHYRTNLFNLNQAEIISDIPFQQNNKVMR